MTLSEDLLELAEKEIDRAVDWDLIAGFLARGHVTEARMLATTDAARAWVKAYTAP